MEEKRNRQKKWLAILLCGVVRARPKNCGVLASGSNLEYAARTLRCSPIRSLAESDAFLKVTTFQIENGGHGDSLFVP